MKPMHTLALGSVGLVLALGAATASAEPINLGILDQVVTEFSARAKAWQAVMMNAATWLFWTLGTISLAWTGGMMVLRKADLGEFFAEFIRFILFFGFFLWLLRNGSVFAQTILDSMQKLGAQASGLKAVSPSGIVDVGFLIWQQAVLNLKSLDFVSGLVCVLLSAAILLMLAAIAVNLLLLLVSGWILMYAGIFFLGFGGSRWTSDMAIGYYKSVLGVAVQLLTMILLVGIGDDLLKAHYATQLKGDFTLDKLGVMLIFCLALLMLSSKIPAMVAGIISGGSGASSGVGSFGAGAVMGAAMGAAGVASAAASMAGAALSSGAANAANAAGGAQAVMAAYSRASAAGSGSDAGGMADAAGGGAEEGRCASAFAHIDQGKGGGDSADGGGPGASSQAGESGQAQSEAAGTSQAAGMLGRAAATAGQLAQGSLAVGKAKIASLREGALDRRGQTAGGKLASAIKPAGGPGAAPEVEAFVHRDSRNP